MKNFDDQYLKQQTQTFYDPSLYLTKQVQQEILELQTSAFNQINLNNILGIILTAPLTTITASLQLSVIPHKNIYQDKMSKSKELAKLNTSITLQQKRRMQLMIRSGGEHRPYIAPIHQSYLQAIKSLLSQGYKSFFKGLFFRCIHQVGHFYSYSQINLLDSNLKGSEQNYHFIFQVIKLYALQCLTDISLNIFHIGQNRYILQNNIQEFKVFRNMTRFIKKLLLNKQIFIAYPYHFINNLTSLLLRMPLYFTINNHQLNPMAISLYYIAEMFIYPFNTIFRRLQCQHTDIPGMIPIRYSSIWHGISLISQEEGIFKGLYKGFGLNHITIIWKIFVMYNLGPLLNGLRSVEQF